MTLVDEIKGALADADPFASWWPFVVAGIVFIVGTVRAYMGGQQCPNGNAIAGHVVVVTGATGGIGREVCRELARRNAHLVLACRNLEREHQNPLSDELRRLGASGVELLALDLASLDSVRRFARRLLATHSAIDALVNCAGIIFHPPGTTTVDGYEPHLQCNFLAHLLLTQLLLPALARSRHGPGRIVNVVAHGYTAGRIPQPVDDPLNQRERQRVSGRDAFAHSKLAIVLASRALAKRLSPSTTTINCCTPGLVRGTGHLRHSPIMRALFARILTYPWMWLFMKSPVQGAQTIVRLVTDPALDRHTGGLYNDCEPVELSELAKDEQLAECLYLAALEAIGLSRSTGEEAGSAIYPSSK